jgi:hypothetical protein
MASVPVDTTVKQSGGGHEDRLGEIPFNRLIRKKKVGFPQLWINVLATFLLVRY